MDSPVLGHRRHILASRTPSPLDVTEGAWAWEPDTPAPRTGCTTLKVDSAEPQLLRLCDRALPATSQDHREEESPRPAPTPVSLRSFSPSVLCVPL